MAKGKGKLAAALKTQTARLQSNARDKEREKAKLAAKAPTAPGSTKARRNARANAQAQKQRPVLPFRPTDRILLIGDGDFSFALALIRHPAVGIVPENVVASTLDAEDALAAKYPDSAPANLAELRSKGATVLCGVDATKLGACKALRAKRFDRVVWNFPHVGKGIADQDRNVRENQATLLAFLAAVSAFLEQGPMPSAKPLKYKRGDDNDNEDNEEEAIDVHDTKTRGTVLITLRDAPPYTLWDLPKLAKRSPDPDSPRYVVVRSFAFARPEWAAHGYAHRMTKGHVDGIVAGGQRRSDERTWEFALADAVDP
ncbi:hypothetical protein AURDEDRAFT_79182 [Auricularia subglabra TFB-10046 SS5]|nr:hypothetical protein AURDEDRAFT_79182 [Auricularia subglabra TFB-10046 SS5]